MLHTFEMILGGLYHLPAPLTRNSNSTMLAFKDDLKQEKIEKVIKKDRLKISHFKRSA